MFDEYYRRTWEPENDISPEQTELATSLRVPFLTSEYPRWNYITGIVVRNETYFQVGIVPTDDEVREVAAHLENYCTYYRQSFRDAMKHFAPYDIDGGANLGWYMKRPDGGWCYRKRTWSGPQWWPRSYVDYETGRYFCCGTDGLSADPFHAAGCTKPRHVRLPLSDVIVRNFRGWSTSA